MNKEGQGDAPERAIQPGGDERESGSGIAGTALKKQDKPWWGGMTREDLLAFAREFAVALVVALLVTQFVFIIPLVPTGSMIPTININERILVDKLTRRFMPIKRGDIVVFPCPDSPEELYVKRVIGMPGERVEIYANTVFIDGVPLDEPYLTVSTEGRDGPYDVPEGHIFVMGDNRNLSSDSRRWKTTNYVSIDAVQGRGVAVLWPFSALRWLK